ncbi:MAG: glycosyltransferase [Clostridia bacterium]|nr:glycosyltransferase [Clostridia bacterium]
MAYHIGLLNDSFPPRVDGVAQAVQNYAQELYKRDDYRVTVITPKDKNNDEQFPFPVFRYSSVPTGRRIGYRAGNPFSPISLRRLYKLDIDLLHVHCPLASATLADTLNKFRRLPTILTYHTKFDIELNTRVSIGAIRKTARALIRHNLEVADEVWAVTEKCGESLRKIGYEGEYVVMENGTDFPYGRAPEAEVTALREQYNIPEDRLVFLFVGRMMWYKNVRIILNGLKLARDNGMEFTALMMGDGLERREMIAATEEMGLSNCVLFPGMITDREALRAHYTLADLFLFPSTFDTSGLVVKEAAACDCPSILTRDSCAAEGVTDGHNGFLAAETGEAFGRRLMDACSDRAELKRVGQTAGQTLYLSWETVVRRAVERYQHLIETWHG